MKFVPVAELVRDYCTKNGLALRPTQLSLLDFIDAGIKWRNLNEDVNDPIYCNVGPRAGHTTLWHFFNRALDGQTLTVYLTGDLKRDNARAFPNMVPEHALSQSELFRSALVHRSGTHDRHFLDDEFPYRYIIFDGGQYGMNKAPDWWHQWNTVLRVLAEKGAITIVS